LVSMYRKEKSPPYDGCLLARKQSADILARHRRRTLGIGFVAFGESASMPSNDARMRAWISDGASMMTDTSTYLL
jgi:hypothetical protein